MRRLLRRRTTNTTTSHHGTTAVALLNPRQILAVGVLVFVLGHGLLMQHTTTTNTTNGVDSDSFSSLRQQYQPSQDEAKTLSLDWHQHWKIQRTTTAQSTIRPPPHHHHHHHHRHHGFLSTDNDNNNWQSHPQQQDPPLPPPATTTTTTTTIRSWGANLTTTPLIFVHIGKAGGGTIRARFSAARPNLNSSSDWRAVDPYAVYPVLVDDNDNNNNHTTTTTTRPAYFCNSGHATFRSTPRALYEETLLCPASTPLGLATACPEYTNHRRRQEACAAACDTHDTVCRTVYVGHNIVGAEWHWLPYQMLQTWWRDTFGTVTENTTATTTTNHQHQHHDNDNDNDDDANTKAKFLLPRHLYQAMQEYFATLEPDNTDWCPYAEHGGAARPVSKRDYRDALVPCAVPLARAVDDLAVQILAQVVVQPPTPTPTPPYATTKTTTTTTTPRQLLVAPQSTPQDWSFLYASLPVLRTTIVREPWSWMVSKFFWQGNWHWHDLECDNILQATRLDGKTQRRRLEEENEVGAQDRWNQEEEEEEDQDGDGGFDGGEDESVSYIEKRNVDETANDNNNNNNSNGEDHGPEQRHHGSSKQQGRRKRPKHVMPRYHPDSTIISDTDGFGWAHRYALLYIIYLAGEDAAARYEMGFMGNNEETILEQLERQAANNLRQSFAVVGLLHETDTYFDMLTARVQYLDMSLHPDIQGELHETGTNGYMAKCKKTFADAAFRQAMREASPAVAALERLYDVAVKVNRHQVRELAASSQVDPLVRERLQKAVEQF